MPCVLRSPPEPASPRGNCRNANLFNSTQHVECSFDIKSVDVAEIEKWERAQNQSRCLDNSPKPIEELEVRMFPEMSESSRAP